MFLFPSSIFVSTNRVFESKNQMRRLYFGEKLDEFNNSLILVVCDLFFVHWCTFPKNPGMSQEKDCPYIPVLRMGLEPREGSGFLGFVVANRFCMFNFTKSLKMCAVYCSTLLFEQWPWLFAVYMGVVLFSYIRNMISQYKHPDPTSFMGMS